MSFLPAALAAQTYWQEVFGQQSVGSYCLAVDKHGHYYATVNALLFRSTDGGQTWPAVNYKIIGTGAWYQISSLSIDSTGALFVLADTLDRQWIGHTSAVSVFSSTDSGNTFRQLGAWDGNYRIPITSYPSFEIRPSGLYRFIDSLQVWKQIFSRNCYSPDGQVNFLSSADRRTLILGAGSEILLSHDQGEHWARIDSGYSGADVFALAWTRTGALIVGGLTGAFLTPDEGVSWRRLSIRKDAVYQIVCNSVGTLFAAMYNGVMRSTDDGETWDWWNDGLTNHMYEIMKIDSSGYVYVVAWDYGLFRSAKPTTHVRDLTGSVPTSLALHAVTPNPSTGLVHVDFSLAGGGNVQLRAYDVLGREIALIVNQDLRTGRHDVPWDARRVAPGAYVLQLTSGTDRCLQRILIVK